MLITMQASRFNHEAADRTLALFSYFQTPAYEVRLTLTHLQLSDFFMISQIILPRLIRAIVMNPLLPAYNSGLREFILVRVLFMSVLLTSPTLSCGNPQDDIKSLHQAWKVPETVVEDEVTWTIVKGRVTTVLSDVRKSIHEEVSI